MQKVREIFNLPEVDKDLGIEVELETMGDVPFPEIPRSTWNYCGDGSLRGNYNVEYVSKPISWENVPTQINHMKKALGKKGVTIDYSYRAGVHVHMNCQELTMEEVLKIACLYYVVEENLINYCGPDRVGNYNCLRAVDAEGVIELLKRVMSKQTWNELGTDEIRYAALNFNSLPKYGTIEFRAMSSQPDLDTVTQWTQILKQIREVALEYVDAKEIMSDFSSMSPENWGNKVFGEFFNVIKPNPVDYFDGLWLAQDLANFEKLVEKPKKRKLKYDKPLPIAGMEILHGHR